MNSSDCPCIKHQIKTIEELLLIARAFCNQDTWYFRGQADSEWHLETSFERKYKEDYNNKLNCNGGTYNFILPPSEKAMRPKERSHIHEFRRHAHKFVDANILINSETPSLDLLSIMQHHGIPTRLLDFSEAFFVALYMAIESLEKEGKASLWAINKQAVGYTGKVDEYRSFTELNKRVEGFLNKDDHNSGGITLIKPRLFIARLSAQQGLFLFPNSIELTFEQNLMMELGKISAQITFVNEKKKEKLCDMINKSDDIKLIKLTFSASPSFVSKIRNLLKGMNITPMSLYPDVQGVTRHLAMQKF